MGWTRIFTWVDVQLALHSLGDALQLDGLQGAVSLEGGGQGAQGLPDEARHLAHGEDLQQLAVNRGERPQEHRLERQKRLFIGKQSCCKLDQKGHFKMSYFQNIFDKISISFCGARGGGLEMQTFIARTQFKAKASIVSAAQAGLVVWIQIKDNRNRTAVCLPFSAWYVSGSVKFWQVSGCAVEERGLKKKKTTSRDRGASLRV